MAQNARIPASLTLRKQRLTSIHPVIQPSLTQVDTRLGAVGDSLPVFSSCSPTLKCTLMCLDGEIHGTSFHLDTIYQRLLIIRFLKKKKKKMQSGSCRVTCSWKFGSPKLLKVAHTQTTRPSGSSTATVKSRFQSRTREWPPTWRLWRRRRHV